MTYDAMGITPDAGNGPEKFDMVLLRATNVVGQRSREVARETTIDAFGFVR